MIATSTLTLFIGTCVLLALTPGPNMSLIVANTLSGGLRAGLTTLAGTGTGLAISVTVAALGMSSVMLLMATWFEVVRWVGAVYLIVLGARQLWGWWQRREGGLPPPPRKDGTNYIQGLLVALSNPKVLLFLGAFLPQFVDTTRDPLPQLVTLAIIFWVTLIVTDFGYTYAIARARQAIDMRKLAVMDGLAGCLLMIGGIVLATARKPV
jgi:homoserine/homoserine lactone efflux protein